MQSFEIARLASGHFHFASYHFLSINAQISHYRNPELIDKRSRRVVEVGPGGTLSDYVPFYFTPFSIMMYNIKTGFGGVPRVANEEIVILVSSLSRFRNLASRSYSRTRTRMW